MQHRPQRWYTTVNSCLSDCSRSGIQIRALILGSYLEKHSGGAVSFRRATFTVSEALATLGGTPVDSKGGAECPKWEQS